jgi:hypothetical protein
MTLSDFRTGHPPIENVGGATSTSAGYPPMTQTTFLTCRAHYPGGSNRCVSVSFPVHAAFPNYLVGRHPRRHFRGLLKLHSRYGLQDCSPAEGGLLSRGFSPASYPTKPLGSYHVLPTSTWVNPPFTGDLRRWGAQVMEGCAVIHSYPLPDRINLAASPICRSPSAQDSARTRSSYALAWVGWARCIGHQCRARLGASSRVFKTFFRTLSGFSSYSR